MLEERGLTRRECYVCTVVKCRPPGNRDPLPDEIASCRPYLAAQLELVDPRVIVSLGNFATKLLLGTTEGISKLRGRAYPLAPGVLVPPSPPPAVPRGGGERVPQMRPAFVRAKRLLGRPPAPP